MKTEQYKDIEGYEGMYAVSNKGRVKSLNYHQTGEEHIMTPSTIRGGYLQVHLKQKGHLIHRLVANAFIPNPDNKPEINHKDEDKTNNNVENLEWRTHEENCNYGTRNKRVGEAITNRSDLSMPVDILDKQGEFIRQFPSASEAERWLRTNGFPKAAHQNISDCCKDKRNTAYGFKWRYSTGN